MIAVPAREIAVPARMFLCPVPVFPLAFPVLSVLVATLDYGGPWPSVDLGLACGVFGLRGCAVCLPWSPVVLPVLRFWLWGGSGVAADFTVGPSRVKGACGVGFADFASLNP